MFLLKKLDIALMFNAISTKFIETLTIEYSKRAMSTGSPRM